MPSKKARGRQRAADRLSSSTRLKKKRKKMMMKKDDKNVKTEIAEGVSGGCRVSFMVN